MADGGAVADAPEAVDQNAKPPERGREVRVGLVLNGGVSLAVWIGGVTRELDAARRGSIGRDGNGDTSELYREILDALGDDLVVDVIAGASAGGINGVLLGTAIYNNSALDDLQETWLSMGDFRKLLRSPAISDPPSIMQGDDVVLAGLRKAIDGLWSTGTPQPPGNPLYVYVTATDLFGFPIDFEDSRGMSFEEVDHRRVFSFEYNPPDPDKRFVVEPSEYSDQRDDVMRSIVRFEDADAADLLARAARSSSSFPVAFEAHRLEILDLVKRRKRRNGANGDDPGRRAAVKRAVAHWMVDGGILDNQPFNPVLDRVAVLPAGKAVRRSIVYIVPYATAVGSTPIEPPEVATARDTYTAAGSLPRDLPKLQSLERISRERVRQSAAEAERRRVGEALTPGVLAEAAKILLRGYQEARFGASHSVFDYWASERFRPGSGTIAQHPTIDPKDVLDAPETDVAYRPVRWIPETTTWDPHQGSWNWGLSPAERVATWALLLLRDAAEAEARRRASRGEAGKDSRARNLYVPARRDASRLIARTRAAKIALRQAFIAAAPESAERLPVGAVSEDVISRAAHAYAAIEDQLVTLQEGFGSLDTLLQEITHKGVQYLLDLEVARSGTAVNDGNAPAPFNFVFASARVDNSLGHQAKAPDTKLAGMKLNHFGGFLKRSWRANDWLWGRLDGVEHIMRVLIDDKVLMDLDSQDHTDLATIAFPDVDPAVPGAVDALRERWQDTWRDLGNAEPSENPRQELTDLLATAKDTQTGDDERKKIADACRRALGARLQLRILASDLRRVAETAKDDVDAGSSRIASGAFWANRYPLDDSQVPAQQLVSLFQDMRVGEETLADESSSRLVLDVGAQTAAMAAAVFAGDRGGLPAAARGALGSVRGSTLTISRLVRLIAREPWLGAAAVAVLTGLMVWAAVSKSTLLGATLPALALLVVVSGLSLLTIATGVLEQAKSKLAQTLALGAFAGIPLGFALIAWWPRLSATAARWLYVNTGHAVTIAAAVAAFVATGAAITRVGGGGLTLLLKRRFKIDLGGRWIRSVLLVYRGAVAAGLGMLGVGFIVQRTLDDNKGNWAAVADAKRGTLLIIVLVAVLLVVSVLEEISAPLRRLGRRLLTLNWRHAPILRRWLAPPEAQPEGPRAILTP